MTAFRCCACLKRDRFFMLYGVVICLVMYGSELVNSPVGVDDDLFLALPENEVFWCTQGRFVPYLFLKILHQYPFVPGFSLLSSLVASLLAFEIIFFTYDRRLNVLKYLTFPIFCGCSTLFHSYSFLCLASVMGWGFLFSAVSWRLLKKRNAVSVVLSVVSGIAALGCYQVFIAFLASLQIFDLLRKNDRTRMRGGELVRRMSFSAVYLAVVYAGYMVCNKIVLRFIGAAPDEYVSGLLTSLPRSAGHLFQILRRSKHFFY